ncbi:MAG: ATP-dependent nuclease [Halomonadaceae bacterium]|uniref:ATP-binding protein n=1 Tax=Halomonas colorata TaxID=2742615 RepID=A0ABR9FWY3_9GAMM|nr:ATP-binding protein [Halomonas colorata]MBE0463139.1 ATP-binding protein [Halomonas colorata]
MKKNNKTLQELSDLSKSKKKLKDNFPNFIHKIRFPVYKNIEPNCEISFEYPLTVFVGQNGCGKSSVLHAIQGAPANKSVGNFWFSTNLDPIKESRGKPSCFIYEYYNEEAKKFVEVVKLRVKYDKIINGRRRVNPDYWEPKRASVEYGMLIPQKVNGKPEPGSLASKRWEVPKINVEYLDFRSELSAFDQYFYFGEQPKNLVRYNTKQDRLRSWVKNQLTPILTGKRAHSFRRNSKKLNSKPSINLSDDEVSIISYILGKNYIGCKMVKHSIFGTLGYSVQFISKERSYTEAFAGSGEMAVVRVVNTVANAEESSLILLDEPEVSLHPGAQKKLRDYLLEICRDKKHQVIICTHSPVFLEGLPESAIKVFVPNSEGRFRVVGNVYVNDAFIQIGQTVYDKKRIIVEDAAAKSLVDHALKILGADFEESIDVQYYPGGESSIFKDLVVHSRKQDDNIFVIFDGDIYQGEWPREESVSRNDLDQVIKHYCQQSVEKLNFRNDGGNDRDSGGRIEQTKREYLRYLSEKCFFLPVEIPEELIWEASTINGKEDIERRIGSTGKGRFKEYIGLYVEGQTGTDSSADRAAIIRQTLNMSFDHENEDFQKLKQILIDIKDYH